MMPSAKRKQGSVPSPNRGLPKDYASNKKSFNPGPVNKGPDSTAGESDLAAANDGTAPDMSKT